jgi:hypothetical protein
MNFAPWCVLAAAAVAPMLPPLDLGSFEVSPGLGGIVVAAPHEGFDMRTSAVASGTATVLGSGYVVATGFRGGGHLINVNRPTEGVGLAPMDEVGTERAATVHSAYLARLGEAARGSLRLLVEIHGNARPENVGVVEVATVGISRDRALALRKRLAERLPSVAWRVEPLDVLHYQASASKAAGALARAPLALHFEQRFAVRIVPNSWDLGPLIPETPREMVKLLSRRMAAGDAVVAASVERLDPKPRGFVSWDAEHFRNKLLVPVLLPTDSLPEPVV